MKKYRCEVCDWVYDPQLVIRMEELLRALHSRIFRKIGYVPFVVWGKMNLSWKNNYICLQKIRAVADVTARIFMRVFVCLETSFFNN